MSDVDIGAVIKNIIESTPQLELIQNKVFPDAVTQNVHPPFAYYAIISDQHNHILSGLGGITNTSMLIEVVSNSKKEAGLLGRTIVRALVGLRGQFDNTFINSISVLDGPRSFELQPTGGQEVYRYVSAVTLSIYYQEPVSV
jgi:hypothetical protein